MVERNTDSEPGTSPSRRTFIQSVGAALPVASGDTDDPILGSDDDEEEDSSSGSDGDDSSSGSDDGESTPDADDSSSDGDGEYRTVVVEEDEHEHVEVPDGGTLEDVLYDITADGASVFFDANGNGWTMRNVGVEGVNSTGGPIMHASAPDADGTGRLENVYFGDGTSDGDGMGIWVDATDDDAHRGTLAFDRVHVARFADNGIYASGPGLQLGADRGGEVHIRNSLARNNNISQFRVGTNGSSITNSLALVDGDVPSTNGIVNPRGIWLREEATDITVENTETVMRGGHGALAMVAHKLGAGSVSDSVVDGPTQGEDNLSFEDVLDVAKGTPSPPKGVPMSAEEAASGR